jgi:hypothetical protein
MEPPFSGGFGTGIKEAGDFCGYDGGSIWKVFKPS